MVKVLVIDDDPGIRKLLRRMLESVKLHVIEAANGVTGLSLFHEHRPVLVITDIQMPEKDGIETLREIRKADPSARVIALSGGGGEKYPNALALARELGATAALEKPIRREHFLAAVTQTLAGASGWSEV